MRNKGLIVTAVLISVAAVALSSCIVSASPDTSKTVVVKPNEPVEFKVNAIPQSACVWRLDGVVQPETGGKYNYKPASSDVGDRTLTVTVSGSGSRTWKISVEQEASLAWEWVSEGSGADRALSAHQTADGGYIAAGTYHQHHADGIYSADRGYVVKLDRSGSKEWVNLYSEPSGWDIHANSIQQTSDGGYIIAGDKQNNDGWVLGLIIKIDSAGNIEWQSPWGNENKCVESKVAAIRQTSDGGYIAAGYSSAKDIPGVTNHGYNDAYVVKLDASGNIEWQQMYGGSGNDYAWDIRQTTDGGYAVAGASESLDIPGITGQGNYFIIKLDRTGSVEWQKLLPPDSITGASSISQSMDGGYIVVGPVSNFYYYYISSKGESITAIKLDESGIEIWRKTFDAGNADTIQQTFDGGYIIAGQLYSYDYRYCKGYLLKLNSTGDKEWQQHYGGEKQRLIFFDVVQTADGGFVAAGSRDNGLWSGFLAYGFDQGGWGWRWVDTYLGNHDDFYILKVGPDGEMN